MSERTSLTQTDAVEVDLASWTRQMDALGFKTDAARARALRMHWTVIGRLRSGESKPGPKFIARTTGLGIPYASCFYNGDA